MRLSSVMPGMAPNVVGTSFNRFDSLSSAREQHARRALGPSQSVYPDGMPPKNVHGEDVFLCKFQVSLFEAANPSSMLVYDRKMSFQAHLLERGGRTHSPRS